MTEKKRKKIVYAIFVLAIIWGIFNLPFGNKTELESHNHGDLNEEAIEVISSSVSEKTLNLEQDWGDDPFAIKKAAARQFTRQNVNFKLTAISESNGVFWALINGEILSVGDSIDGWKLIEVTKKRAVLTKNQETIRLKIQDA